MESVAMVEASMVRLEELEERDREIESKINKLATVAGVEEEIRSKFSVAKDNENMVIIVREEGTSSPALQENKGFWSKIRSLFR